MFQFWPAPGPWTGSSVKATCDTSPAGKRSRQFSVWKKKTKKQRRTKRPVKLWQLKPIRASGGNSVSRRREVKNAHERFGWLEFTRTMRDTTVRVRLRLDRCIAEVAENGRDGKFHLLSVVGGESDVSAAWAAVHQNQVFKVEGPDFAALDLSLGEKAECYRGSLSLPGRRRPVRDLLAVSAELANTRLGAAIESNRTILSENDSVFVLY